MCNIFVYKCFNSFWRLNITGFVIKCPDQHLAERRSASGHRQNKTKKNKKKTKKKKKKPACRA